MNTKTLSAMYKHLLMSFSAQEAKDILISKFPHLEGDVEMIADSTIYSEVERVVDVDAAMLEIEAEVDKVVEEHVVENVVKKATKEAKPMKVTKGRANSKMAKARQLFASTEDKSRKNMIEIFVKELELSPASASIYFYTIKKGNS